MHTHTIVKINEGKARVPEFSEDEARRRLWVASLKVGDEVEVPYSRIPTDIVRMKVVKSAGGWLHMLPEGYADISDNWVIACAVNGWTRPLGIRLVPPGTTTPLLPLGLRGFP